LCHVIRDGHTRRGVPEWERLAIPVFRCAGYLSDARTHSTPQRARATRSAPTLHASRRTRVRWDQIDDDLRKRLQAIEVLLQEPGDISDALEAELYALRDKLQATALP
jgi:hypothetical protein